MNLASGLLVLLLTAGGDPDLVAAEESFQAGRYDAVLPSVERALKHALPPKDEARAYELKAMTHAAFDNSAAAIEAFRHLITVDPNYAPKSRVSPKVQGLFAEAVRLGPIGIASSPSQPQTAPPRPSEPKPEIKEPAVASGEAPTVSATPVPIPVGPPPTGEARISERWSNTRIAGVATAVAAVVAFGAGAGFGADSQVARNRLLNPQTNTCGQIVSPTQNQAFGLRNEANTNATVANVLFVAGGAFAVSAAVLLLIPSPRSSSLSVAAGPSGVIVQGDF
jgi:hypothetical protein